MQLKYGSIEASFRFDPADNALIEHFMILTTLTAGG